MNACLVHIPAVLGLDGLDIFRPESMKPSLDYLRGSTFCPRIFDEVNLPKGYLGVPGVETAKLFLSQGLEGVGEGGYMGGEYSGCCMVRWQAQSNL